MVACFSTVVCNTATMMSCIKYLHCEYESDHPCHICCASQMWSHSGKKNYHNDCTQNTTPVCGNIVTVMSYCNYRCVMQDVIVACNTTIWLHCAYATNMTWMVTISHLRCKSLRILDMWRYGYYVTYRSCILCNHLILRVTKSEFSRTILCLSSLSGTHISPWTHDSRRIASANRSIQENFCDITQWCNNAMTSFSICSDSPSWTTNGKTMCLFGSSGIIEHKSVYTQHELIAT